MTTTNCRQDECGGTDHLCVISMPVLDEKFSLKAGQVTNYLHT